MADLRDETAAALGRAAARAADFGVTPCLETHDHHSDPADVAYIVAAAGHPNVGVVWHPAHHLRLGVSVPAAYELLRPWVRHCHISERPSQGQERIGDAPVPLGSGDAHTLEVMKLLKADGFGGVLSWEWINGGLSGGKPILDSVVDARPYLAQYASKLHEWDGQI